MDRKNAPTCAKDTAAILMVALGRNLRRYAAKMKRVELLDDVSNLIDPASHGASGISKLDCLIDTEKVSRKLSSRSRVMLHLRTVGFDWKEIAAALKTTDCAARAEFSREIRRLRGESSSGSTCSRSQKGREFERSGLSHEARRSAETKAHAMGSIVVCRVRIIRRIVVPSVGRAKAANMHDHRRIGRTGKVIEAARF